MPPRIVVLAQTPPPRHGQSLMVARLVEVLRRVAADGSITVELIPLHLSRSLDEVGGFSPCKVMRAVGCLLRVLALRLKGPIDVLYYVPATGLRSQVWRDWLVLGIGRRLARRTVLHWHGLGLREFYDNELGPAGRALTRWTHGRHSLSLVLAEHHRREVAWLKPEAVEVAPNFIPDPLAGGSDELHNRRKGHSTRDLEVLFFGHMTRSKGIFDLIDGVAIANRRLEESGQSWRVRLTAGGEFADAREKAELEKRLTDRDLTVRGSADTAVTFRGYVEADEKRDLFLQSDVLCLPTYYHAEAQPVVLIEALAYGLEIVVSDWRNLPALLPSSAFVVPTSSPAAIAEALISSAAADSEDVHRAFFLEHYEQGKVAREIVGKMKR